MADNKYTIQDLQDNLNYLNDTKTLIKQAIIDKGQEVSEDDTFRSYANKIEAIETGVDTSDATATPNDLVYPKTAYVNGTKIAGAITEKTEPLGVTPYKIRTSIEGVSDLVACNEDDIVLFTSPENLYVYKYDTVNKVFNLLRAIPNTTMYNKRIKITNCFYNNNDWCILITYSNYTVRSTNYVKDVAHIAELKYINGEYILTDNITQVGTEHYWLNPEFVYNKNNNLYLATYYRTGGNINQYICIYKLNYIPFSGECSYVTNISDIRIYDYGSDFYNNDAHFVYHSSYITSSGEMILFSGFYGDNNYGTNKILRLNSDLTSIVHQIDTGTYLSQGQCVAYDDLYINLYFYAELIRYTIYKWNGTNYVKINKFDTNYPKGFDITKCGAFTIKLVQNMLIFTYLNSNNQCLSYTAFIENDTLRFGETYDDPMNYPITHGNSDDIQTTSKFAMIKYGSDIKLFGIDTNGTRRLALTDINYTYYNTYNSDVVASDILVDKTAYNNQGIVKGSMPNNGALSYTPSDSEQSIPLGYTSGGTVAAADITKLNDYKSCLRLTQEILGGER